MSLFDNSVYDGVTSEDNITLNESQNVPDMDEGLEEFKVDHTFQDGVTRQAGEEIIRSSDVLEARFTNLERRHSRK